jgi:hypothetical protein
LDHHWPDLLMGQSPAGGKGDRRRPAAVRDDELEWRWAETFGPETGDKALPHNDMEKTTGDR